jgi:hypothetical protein
VNGHILIWVTIIWFGWSDLNVDDSAKVTKIALRRGVFKESVLRVSKLSLLDKSFLANKLWTSFLGKYWYPGHRVFNKKHLCECRVSVSFIFRRDPVKVSSRSSFSSSQASMFELGLKTLFRICSRAKLYYFSSRHASCTNPILCFWFLLYSEWILWKSFKAFHISVSFIWAAMSYYFYKNL